MKDKSVCFNVSDSKTLHSLQVHKLNSEVRHQNIIHTHYTMGLLHKTTIQDPSKDSELIHVLA